MYKGFKLTLNDWGDICLLKNIEDNSTEYNQNKDKVEKTLNSFILSNGSIDASKMQENWFPNIKADIFISHSHKDLDLAISLSKIFEKKELKVFIDSCVWGYADDLLKKIDDKYCLNKSRETYDYNKRNISTGHVHMMLSTALSMMIDKAECLIFLNTPNSIKVSDFISKTDKTISPWIYHELSISILIQKILRREVLLEKSEAISKEASSEIAPFDYKVNLNHLNPMYLKKLLEIQGKGYGFLDKIYEIFPTVNKNLLY